VLLLRGSGLYRHKRSRYQLTEGNAGGLAQALLRATGVSKIGRRLVVASGLVLLVVGVAFAVLLLAVADLQASQHRLEHSREVLKTANQLERLVVDLEMGQRDFILTGQERFLEPWHAARDAVPERSRTLMGLVGSDPVQERRARSITRQAASYLNDYAVPLLDDARRDPASARSVPVTEEGNRRMDAMRAEFDQLVATERAVSARRQEHTDTVARWAFVAAATGLAGSVLLILAATVDSTRTIVRPVLETAAMATRLADGDLSVRVPETGVGEIRMLERAFNTMAGSLEVGRAELAASRARLVRSGDETRRRIERDLHDGIQQRLVSLALHLRALQASAASEDPELRSGLNRVAEGLQGALDDLREISRGIHPAILSEGGLGPALQMLSRRCAIPVEVDLSMQSRLPPPVEVAAYYVVAEALTNAAKHSGASFARVRARLWGDRLLLSVHDDGSGGADPARGTGLIGLTDRIQALGGTITVYSPMGEGTTLDVDLPVRST
jgi:signal transduction histidine kinase